MYEFSWCKQLFSKTFVHLIKPLLPVHAFFSELPENQKKWMHPKSPFLTQVINQIHSFDLFKPAQSGSQSLSPKPET